MKAKDPIIILHCSAIPPAKKDELPVSGTVHAVEYVTWCQKCGGMETSTLELWNSPLQVMLLATSPKSSQLRMIPDSKEDTPSLQECPSVPASEPE